MARVLRNELERELDLIFLINLARTMGTDFSGTKAHEMLNLMRGNVAVQQALIMGTDAEVARAQSQLSVQSVRRQLAQARKRANATAQSGMAWLIEDQLSDLQAELEDSYAKSAMVEEDILLSRRVTQRMTKGRFRDAADQQRFTAAGDEMMALVEHLGIQGTQEGARMTQLVSETMAQPTLEPQELVTVVKDSAASASLYTRITAERDSRRKIRQEMRELYYGHEVIGTAQGRQNLLQVVGDQRDPARAREQALEALGEELRVLLASGEIGAGPWTPEMIKVHRARTADTLQRIQALRALDDAKGDAGDEFVFRVVEADPRTGVEGTTVIFPD